MELSEILDLIMVLLFACTFGFLLYFKVRGNLMEVVSEFIAMAETTNLTGPEKMAKVVEQLMFMVPAPLQAFFTAARLEAIAQWVFDWMRKYADEYRAKIQENTTEEEAKEISQQISSEAAMDIVAELLTLTLDALLQKATEHGIDTEGMADEKEIAVAIAKAIITKATAGSLPPA